MTTGGAVPSDKEGAEEYQPTILVVEDIEATRLFMVLCLSQEGYRVLAAGTAHDALAMFQQPFSTIDVVLLDVHLYRERSDVLIAECHAQIPPVPVVLVTGSADVTQDGLSEADAILPKPFELGELLTTVSRLARVHAHR